MNVICAPSGIVDTERPGQGISDIAKAGFENILLDFTMYCPPAELESAGKPCAQAGHQNGTIIPKQPSAPQSGKPPRRPEGTWLQSLVQAPAQHSGEELPEHPAGKLLRSCKETHLTLPIATAPYLSRDTKQRDGKELLTRLTRESIRICGEAGSRYLIVRPLPAAMPSAEAWETNRDFYLSLGDSARKSGVTILLENQCRSLNGHLIRGACAEAEEAASWVDSLNEAAGEERFGFCMNTGTYNLCGQNMREIAVQLGSRVKALLLRDCDGQRESSLLPFTAVCGGQPRTDWLGLIRGLRESGFDGELVLDFSDTAAVFSPMLRPQLLTLAKSVAEYFKWQIGIETTLKKYPSIVLFGAGNMCRNYMKCYGEKYPPLFTCDNNPSLWGTTFCGLEVRAPESLACLPEGCAIFICNIYYREIAQQLRGMQVTNPIEFFNDEYMPSFYFDRLQRY